MKDTGYESSQKARVPGYDSIRFFATIMVVFWHFYTTCTEQGIPVLPVASQIADRGSINIGGVGVGLFFILSGALLTRQGKCENIFGFYKHRLSRLLVPQWIAFSISLAVAYVIHREVIRTGLLSIFISFNGLNYCSIPWVWWGLNPPWLIGEWFTAVIIILYLLFPILSRLFCNHRVFGTLLILAVFCVNLKTEILTGQNGYFSITNGIMYFWLGMLFETYRDGIDLRIIVSCAVLFCCLLFINPQAILQITYLPCFFASVLLFPVLFQVSYSSWFTRYICKLNYEIYLIHHRVYIILIPVLLYVESNVTQVCLCFVVLTGLVLILAGELKKATQILESIQKLYPLRF